MKRDRIFTTLLIIACFNSGPGANDVSASTTSTCQTKNYDSSIVPEKMTLAESPGSVRATILSVSSMAHRFMLSILIFSFGLFSDRYGLPNTFVGIGIFGGLSLGTLLIFWNIALSID